MIIKDTPTEVPDSNNSIGTDRNKLNPCTSQNEQVVLTSALDKSQSSNGVLDALANPSLCHRCRLYGKYPGNEICHLCRLIDKQNDILQKLDEIRPALTDVDAKFIKQVPRI
jgi:hypothetical protein